MKPEVEELGAVHQLPGEPKILTGRGRIPGGVVVDQNERGRPRPERRP